MKKNKFLLFFLVVGLFFVLFGCSNKETKFNVTFVLNNNDANQTIEVSKASDIKLPSVSKEGFELEGWYLDESFSVKFDSSKELDKNITLYAKWNELEFTVKFIVDGEEVKQEKVKYNASATAPAVSVEGKVFTKWDKDFTNVKENLTVTALFDVLKFTVKFMVDDTEIKTEEVEYGKSATKPADPTKDGFEFTGWDKDFSNVRSNLVVNAVFTQSTFTITYYDGETLLDLSPKSYNKGDSVTLPEPEKDGYFFDGWCTDATLAHLVKKDDFKNNLTLYARWEEIEYSVAFFVDGKSYAIVTCKYGESATAPEDPSKPGYTFVGWNEDFSVVTDDLVVVAIFEEKLYSITYHNGDATLDIEPKTFKYGASLELPVISENGYIFAGWYSDNEFKERISNDSKPVDDLDLYALFLKVEYNGGTTTWTTNPFDSVNTVTKGIEKLSTLPSEFERDFFNYLSDNNLLNASNIDAGYTVSSFEEFTALNPHHNGDPVKIWNDCASNKANDASAGYAALFLYGTMKVDADGNLVDVRGGFLGTEPYKTKYFTLSQHLLIMFKRYNGDMTGGGASNCQLVAFILDGYFYGTQSVTSSSNAAFAAFRAVIPTPTKYYTWDGTKAVEHTREYSVTTDFSSIEKFIAVPMQDNKVFAGWYSDSACTVKLSDTTITNKMSIYAKWE